MPIMEMFRRKRQLENPAFDPYENIVGEKMNIAVLLSIRGMEDYWIELGHITEEERHPVPEYLLEDWTRAVGVDEVNRPRDLDF